jgi:hypothetical protein
VKEKRVDIMARLLTADEIRQLPRASIVWIEFYNAEEGAATSLMASMKCADGTLVSEDVCVYEDFEEDMKPQADGWWRFWSSEPTEQEREGAPWRK